MRYLLLLSAALLVSCADKPESKIYDEETYFEDDTFPRVSDEPHNATFIYRVTEHGVTNEYKIVIGPLEGLELCERQLKVETSNIKQQGFVPLVAICEPA